MKAGYINFPGDGYEAFKYPGGEWQVRLTQESIKYLTYSDEIQITARITSADEIMQVVLLISAIRGVNCVASITLYLPYLPYSRADRRFTQGDCQGLGVFLDVLRASWKVKVKTLDVHNPEAVPDWVENISALPKILQAINHHARGQRQITIVFPDKGASERYKIPDHIGDLTIQKIYCTKTRDAVTGEVIGFSLPPVTEFLRVLVVDDICDGGRTFIEVGKALGISTGRLGLYVTHGIWSKGLQELSKYYSNFYTTDSWEQKLYGVTLV